MLLVVVSVGGSVYVHIHVLVVSSKIFFVYLHVCFGQNEGNENAHSIN